MKGLIANQCVLCDLILVKQATPPTQANTWHTKEKNTGTKIVFFFSSDRILDVFLLPSFCLYTLFNFCAMRFFPN